MAVADVDALIANVSDLQSNLQNKDTFNVENVNNLLIDIKQICLFEIQDINYDLCCSELFDNNKGLLTVLSSAIVGEEELQSSKAFVLEFISQFIQKVGKRIIPYAVDIKSNCLSVFIKAKMAKVKVAALPVIIKLLEMCMGSAVTVDLNIPALRDRMFSELTQANKLKPTGMACLQPVVHLFMQRLGLSTIEIGAMSAILPFVTFFTQPLMGYLADTYNRHKLIFVILLLTSCLGYNSLALLLQLKYNVVDNIAVTQNMSDFTSFSNATMASVENNTVGIVTESASEFTLLSEVTTLPNESKVTHGDIDNWLMFKKLFWIVLSIRLAIMVCFPATPPMLNAITYMMLSNAGDKSDRHWGYQRLYGSIGACSSVLWSSVIVDTFRSDTISYQPSFYIASLFMGIAVLVTYPIKLGNTKCKRRSSIITFNRCNTDETMEIASTIMDENMPLASLVRSVNRTVMAYFLTQSDKIAGGSTNSTHCANIDETITVEMDKFEGNNELDNCKSAEQNLSIQFDNTIGKYNNTPTSVNKGNNGTKTTPKKLDSHRNTKGTQLKSSIILFFNRRIALFYVWNFVIGMYKIALGGYVFLYLHEMDNGEPNQTIYGAILGVGLLVEIPMYYLCGRIVEKVGENRCLVGVLVCLCMRCLILSVITQSWMAVIAAPINGIMNTVIQSAANTYAKKMVSEDMLATALGTMSGVRYGLGSGAGGLLTGVMFYTVGTRWTYRIYTIIAVIFSIVYIILQRLVERNTDTPEEPHCSCKRNSDTREAVCSCKRHNTEGDSTRSTEKVFTIDLGRQRRVGTVDAPLSIMPSGDVTLLSYKQVSA